MNSLTCRFCAAPLTETFVDLGVSPVANALVPVDKKDSPEFFYPLHVYICKNCLLVQIPNTVDRSDIFNNQYTYFSSYSESWLRHARDYVEMATKRFKLKKSSFVVELASNDGYLLKNFVNKNIPVLGIEPSANVAEEARKKGVHTLVEFFGVDSAKRLAKTGKQADLIIANNVLAHVPDINDFIKGIEILLKPKGVITAEFPHIVNLIEKNQFDTIYHEHYSYFSFTTIEKIFKMHGIILFDVEQLPTHGGSLRIYGKLKSSATDISSRVVDLRRLEKDGGYDNLSGYKNFFKKVNSAKLNLLDFIVKAKKARKTIAGYGAAAKGNTFLNFCGLGGDLIDYVVDDSPYKQNHLLPGTRIPVYPSSKIKETRPDYIFILPWNLKKEIAEKVKFIKEWGGSCFVAIPKVELIKI